MSAELYGARLLEEVQEESLEQFLAELRCTIDPRPGSVLGVPPLDNLLESLHYPAVQDTPPRRGWPSSPPAAPAVFEDNRSDGEDQDDAEISPRRLEQRAPTEKAKPATIELTSLRSASGKTSLLCYLCAVAVLPRDLGGKASTVVYIDADGRFSAARLAQITNHYIQNHRSGKHPSAAFPDSDIEQTIRSSLDHIHVFRPQSSAQLISILSSLHTYLLDGSRHHSMHRPLGVIVIDSATAFYWQDRSDLATAKLEAPGTTAGGPSRATETIEKLKALQERFECAVVFSTTTTTAPSSLPFASSSTMRTLNETTTITSAPTTPAPSGGDARFVSPWTSYAALSLSLARLPVAQFPAQMGVEECLRDREKRLEPVRRGRFAATRLPSGAAAHRGPEREEGGDGGRGGKGGRSAFGFRITIEGVEFE
ncbi:uncharacterized protein PV07_07532 [Cladophialophora immunda]|uniref:Rad51-like C-terminal domain-containing protein n=1 Tax=Cladophialophora immunda TaxID=569365 RepID=A0A0D1ZIM7_9EURO|nr:uncharacterized protein PV07_07532 [Cladophialophora immunda]KIW27831.1 hypothetical protein PV07_07532 [Cladophialophora immunda]OQV02986.1 hypothetical protein CLAIMM_08091 [Cladophialophora immunda]